MRASGARVVVAFLTGRTAYGLAYLVGNARDLPIYWYRPLERSFVLGPRPSFFAMEWFGRSFASTVIATAVVALMWRATERRPLSEVLTRPALVRAIAQAAALALIVDFVYFGWVFMNQPALPLPLPPGCAP